MFSEIKKIKIDELDKKLVECEHAEEEYNRLQEEVDRLENLPAVLQKYNWFQKYITQRRVYI